MFSLFIGIIVISTKESRVFGSSLLFLALRVVVVVPIVGLDISG